MFTIGPHLSIADGFEKLGKHAIALGASTAAFFTRNPRGGAARPLGPADIAAFLRLARAHHFGTLVAHAAYTLNAASGEERLRAYARKDLAEDIARMEHLPGSCYNIHPGSHKGQTREEGLRQVAEIVGEALSPDQTTTVLLETMAGKGTEVGGTFEELAAIRAAIPLKNKVGICLDTCHVWDGGYDIVDDLDGVLTQFDKTIGLGNLKAVHLNDSLNDRGARKDRHAGIGEGKIGIPAFGRIINHPALKDLPFILETPRDDSGWAEEIRLLRGLQKEV